jgi:hypothetical protein
MKTLNAGLNAPLGSSLPARPGALRGWQGWAPYAAVAWSLLYAALQVFWLVSGRGFPYASQTLSGPDMRPMIARLGPEAAWTIVIMAGLPAAAVGFAMLRGLRGRFLRPLLIAAGVLLAAVLLLLMPDLNLLILLGYIPYGIVALFSGGEKGLSILKLWGQWTVVHQWLCVLGGFIWLAASVAYARRSGDACLACGRNDRPEGWTSPHSAARWGRIAAYVAMLVPLFYVVTRYAWALGIPLGMTQEHLRLGQEQGTWISGLFLATFGLVGAILILGLVQRWGEVFPRWMIGLAGHRVPMTLAIVPASLVSVLLVVGGIAVWPGYAEMSRAAAATGQDMEVLVGPLALFPFWGLALAVATLGYYFRRRGPCNVCGRGVPGDSSSLA